MAKITKNVENTCKSTRKTTCIKSEINCSKIINNLFRVDNLVYSLTFSLFPTNFSARLLQSINSYFSTFTHSLILLLLNN